MKLPHDTPDPSGTERAARARELRVQAADAARRRPHATTLLNGEEADLGPKYPAQFTKGLLHCGNGLLARPEDYRDFVEAINSHDRHLFDGVQSAFDRDETVFHGTIPSKHEPSKQVAPQWRGWESPRAGHVFELQGPDAGEVGMAPAPRVGSSELAAEMAEVYALAILRDVPFREIEDGGGERLCSSDHKAGPAEMTAKQVAKALSGMPFFSGDCPTSSSTLREGLDAFERRRRDARTLCTGGKVTPSNLFRGSTRGAHLGPYISQFLLIGTDSLAGPDNTASDAPGCDAKFGVNDGAIGYGSLIVDQRTLTHKNCIDHMTSWPCWLDVQNGANVGRANLFEDKRRFITTPRDLATYVHYDALYEAYLNAALILLGRDVPTSKGFPEPSPEGKRTPFATFGGPHILSLVTEVATRCLKAVRRQKFNFHRRARPEALGGRIALMAADPNVSFRVDADGKECTAVRESFQSLHDEIPKEIRAAISRHNLDQNSDEKTAVRKHKCPPTVKGQPKGIGDDNLLLPMAFAEGSPMHPAYGAGHATVAGGCVTMLKAFFDMFEDCDSRELRPLFDDATLAYVPNKTGRCLVKGDKQKEALTIEGELDKLAANIAIGRNMAGVHYYSDYYDSARMGERIAIGILLEQLPTYGDAVETRFHSFDGDLLTLRGDAGEAATLTIVDSSGEPVSPRDWWLRHVPGQDMTVEL